MKIIIDDTINYALNSYYIGVIKDEENIYSILLGGSVLGNINVVFPNIKNAEKIAIKLYDLIIERSTKVREKDYLNFLEYVNIHKDNGCLCWLYLETTGKDYEENDVWEMIEMLEVHFTNCENEKFGIVSAGWTTIQISLEEDGENIGEFVGEFGENNFQFIIYED